MAPEQKHCQRGFFGGKDHFLINSLLEHCKARHRSLSKAWRDYQKDDNRLPYSKLLRCLQLHKISPVLCTLLSCVMEGWRTAMVLSHGKGSLIPLSTELNRTSYGCCVSVTNN